MATGKQTLKALTVPKGDDWVLIFSGAAYIQNTDDEPLRIAFGDAKPTIQKEDGHVMRVHDDYVNDAFDNLWVHQSPTKEHRLTITKYGTV